MKISDALSSLDEYTRRARVWPGFIAASPILVLAVLFLPRAPLAALAPLVGFMGAAFLLANIVRSRGKALEARLVASWDGMPTTHALRYRESQNIVLLGRRRAVLEQIMGSPLPTRRQEQANPAKADEAYIAATRVLISRVRAKSSSFPLVQEENIAYGYARNLLGLKLIGLTLLLLAFMVDAYVLWRNGPSIQAWVAIGIHLALTATWLLFIRESWVRQAGETYAERLFETLDSRDLLLDAKDGQGRGS